MMIQADTKLIQRIRRASERAGLTVRAWTRQAIEAALQRAERQQPRRSA